jgi:hypothetical protein
VQLTKIARKNDAIALGALLFISLLVYIPFVSTTTFGERDAYRVAVGVIDAVRSGQYLASPLLYGIEKSFAYFALINLFAPLFQEKPETIIPVLNYLNAFASILTVIPYYLLVKRYWGMRAAVLANLLLMSVPVWRQTSLYSHPMTLAMMFMIWGLWLISLGSRQDTCKEALSIKFICLEVCSVAVLALCLMNRLDASIMFLMIPGVFLLKKESVSKIFIHSILYILLPILVFFVFKAGLPVIKIEDADKSASFIEQLLFWHNPVRFGDNFIYGSRLFASAFNHLYLLLFTASCVYFWRIRKIKEFLFTFPIVLVNYVFWIPNPDPARHFIYAVPTFTLAIAIFLDNAYNTLRSSILKKKIIKFSSIALLTCLLILSNIGRYEPPYYEENLSVQDLSLLSKHLQNLEKKDKTILVIGDVIPSILHMQISSPKIRVFYKQTNIVNTFGDKMSLFTINNGVNQFVSFSYYHASNSAKDAQLLISNLKEYRDVNLFVDPRLEVSKDFTDKIRSKMLYSGSS